MSCWYHRNRSSRATQNIVSIRAINKANKSSKAPNKVYVIVEYNHAISTIAAGTPRPYSAHFVSCLFTHV